MPRRPREEEAGAIHHVYARGIDRRALFVDDIDRRRYLALLEHVVAVKRWRCLSYCLMGNHIHLMVETPEPNLGRGMQVLHGDFARDINIRHGRSGHVFQGRFGSKVMRDDDHLWTTARYILRNPVDAGLCKAAEEWRWSSHRGVLEESAPVWLDRPRFLERFGTTGGDPDTVYRALIDG